LLLATRVRSLRGERLYAAVGSAAHACLGPVCPRSAGAEEIEPHGALRERGARLPCARSAPPASACDQSPCSHVSMRRRTPTCAARDALPSRESSGPSAFLCRALPGASREREFSPCRASRADAGAIPLAHQAERRKSRDDDCARPFHTHRG